MEIKWLIIFFFISDINAIKLMKLCVTKQVQTTLKMKDKTARLDVIEMQLNHFSNEKS